MSAGSKKRKGMRARVFYARAVPSTLPDALALVDDILHTLQAHGWIYSENECKIRLCLEEALVNAVRHGNRDNPSQTVEVRLLESPECCKIQVRDEGKSLSVRRTTVPSPEQMGGRGLCLIRHYTQKVRYDKARGILEMIFTKPSIVRNSS
jgi:anti-sigma regulatory factor (Ser/Thr protein kinase)